MIERHFFNPETTVNSEMIRRLMHAALTNIRAGKLNDGNRLRITEILDDIDNHRIGFTKFPVPEALRHFILSWSYLFDNSARYETERIVPRIGATLIINLNPERYLTNTPLDAYSGVVVLPNEGYRNLQQSTSIKRIFVHFTPAGLHLLTRIPQEQLANKITDAAYVFGPAFDELHERLMYAPGPEYYLQHLTDFFTMRANKVVDSVPAHVVDYMVNNIETPLSQTIQRTGYSKKHVVNLLKQYIGTTPKQLQLINRLNRIITQFNPAQHSHFPFTETDFYDEAHFSRAFRHHIGMTPLQYKKGGFFCSKRLLVSE